MSLESGGVTIGNGRPSALADHRGRAATKRRRPVDAWPLSVVSLAAVEDEGRRDGADDAEEGFGRILHHVQVFPLFARQLGVEEGLDRVLIGL